MKKICLLLALLPMAGCESRTRDAVLEDRRPAPVERLAAAPVETPVAAAAEVVSEQAAADRWAAERLERRPEAPAVQRQQYAEPRAKSVVELQQFRTSTTAVVAELSGRRGTATLTDLNPAFGEWYLLQLNWEGRTESYHLQNPGWRGQSVALDPLFPHGVVLETPAGRERCDLWSRGADGPLARSAEGDRVYAGICGSRLYVRRTTVGRKTTLERTTDFLRDRIVGGEKITVFVRDNFLKDAHLSTSEVISSASGSAPRPRLPSAPASPAVDAEYQGRFLETSGMGLLLDALNPGEIQVGRWTAVRGIPGVFLSAVQPRLVSRQLRASAGARLNPLDEVELSAMVYMVAYDLDGHALDFALGTDHPRLGWSERVPDSVRIASLPGPDGIADAAPLVRTGMVDPDSATRIVSTFTGGFKRSHGAFKYSELAYRDQGTHYGLVESGTVFSKLHSGLATVLVLGGGPGGGEVTLKTWTKADDERLWRVRRARQNGYPLVEPDPSTGTPRVGSMVPRWGEGNWSGSQEKRLRTLRAGLCLQQSEAGRFLIYGYFSGATPSAMALVFLAYGCEYAMLLDMNALEHTYLALYRVKGGEFLTQHLIGEMSVLDQSAEGQELPRFVGFADNRDFFYVTRKSQP